MSSEIAWVALLSCGHVLGSKPPAMRDLDPPMDSVRAAYAGAQRQVPPPEPEFVPPPDPDQLVYCGECTEGRRVISIIENKDQPLPQRDARRKGTRW